MVQHLPIRALLGAVFALGAAVTASAQPLPVGQRPAVVTLKDDDGGRVDGTPWTSDAVKNKVQLFLYVDPDEEGANPELEKQLKAAKFPKDKFQATAIINMAATWKPNAIIASVLKGRQEDYPDTIYVKDLRSVLVDKWKLTDKNYDVMILDKAGMVLFAKDGEFAAGDVATVLETIRKAL